MNSLSVIIPAFNEGHHIYEVVAAVIEASDEYQGQTPLVKIDVVVVNDGSSDQTANELQRLTETYPDIVQVLAHPFNLGYGAALKSGFDRAKGEYLSFMDGDGTIEPKAIFHMFNELLRCQADMAVGLRFGAHGSKMPVVRKAGNLFFAWLLRFLSGVDVSDTASGVRVFRKAILDQLYPLPDGLHFTPAMSTKAVHEKMHIIEVPIDYRERQGKSKLSVVRDGFRFLRIIVGTVLMYNPFKVFLLVGLALHLVAAILLSAPLMALIGGNSLWHPMDYIYRSIGGFYCMVGGVQIILFGILARFMVSTFFMRFERGVWVHRVNRYIKVYERMSWYGVLVLMAGLSINMKYFLSYLFLGSLNVHWAWVLLAAGLVIVGLQMVITGVVMRILKDIRLAVDARSEGK